MSTVTAPEEALPRDRRPALGGRVGVLRALALVVAVVAMVVVLAPRSNVDAVRVVQWQQTARRASTEAHFQVLTPRGLPTTWRATSVRSDPRHGTLHWHLGFTTPEGGYAGIDESDRYPALFIADMTERGPTAGLSTVRGVMWVRTYAPLRNHRALWLRSDNATTVVGGTASWQELEQLAGSLRPLLP